MCGLATVDATARKLRERVHHMAHPAFDQRQRTCGRVTDLRLSPLLAMPIEPKLERRQRHAGKRDANHHCNQLSFPRGQHRYHSRRGHVRSPA